ncbi:MAG TPA: hypothetical protein VFU79_06235 [Nitrososphaeraceae archaeon]|nr:hypothetical protein [Nitrososphaeraceae archaeon]
MVELVASLLLIIMGLSMIGGIIFGLYYTKIGSLFFDLKKIRRISHHKSTNAMSKEQEKVQLELENVLKNKPDLIKTSSELMEEELKIYQFEKDLANHAIEKILIASKNKSIDSFEKDRLLLKYKDQLKKLNGKMDKIQSEIDVTKLINLRNDLALLLDNKISDIDEKIKEINYKIGTNYKIKEILTQNKKNTSYNDNDSIKNINNAPSVEGERTIDDHNLNFSELTTFKNNPNQKRKEMVIESQRKQIDDLKDQVLVALDRLDKTQDIKTELKDDLDTEKVTQISTFIEKDLQDNYQKKSENNNGKESLSGEHDKQSINSLVENNLNIPTIFGSLGTKASTDDVVTTKMVTDPINQKAEGSLKNYVDVNSEMIINEPNFFTSLDIEKNNTNHTNKNTPLSNILNQNSSKVHPTTKSEYDERDVHQDHPSNNDKPSFDSNENKNINNKSTTKRFKFPLAFIFSKNRKGDENKKDEKSNLETNEERKDSLNNIVNKSNRK